MSPKPTGFDRNYALRTPGGRFEIGVGIDIVRGTVTRFIVQLQLANVPYGAVDQQIARIDHNPTSIHGHDVTSEGIHVDVVLPDGSERTLFPSGGTTVSDDMGLVIDLAIDYFRSHREYFARVHRGTIAPADPPGWP